MNFQPDYRHIVNAAYNREAVRLPLYEHIVSADVIGKITGKDFSFLYDGDDNDIREYFRLYCQFFRDYGYDVIPFECCIGQIMPGAGALGNCRITPAIRTRADFDACPWDEIPDLFFEKNSRYFKALSHAMPEGMKAVGGVGNGVFEIVQDLTGYQNLCYISADDEELYSQLFQKAGQISRLIWTRFLEEFKDTYCLLRFGDDLGYKSNTLLSGDDIRTHILPQYRHIIDLVHAKGKPFLLHSCGCIFSIMEDLIACGINAKHSNEDQIAPFPYWVETYGDRIGNFGGIDLDVVCSASREEMKEYIGDVIRTCSGHGGFAFGSGNSIPDYVPAGGYVNMIEIVREIRGDYRT